MHVVAHHGNTTGQMCWLARFDLVVPASDLLCVFRCAAVWCTLVPQAMAALST
jgi:hypothetical protein